ncbi:MAG: hypothetical protein VKL41_07535 [Snowella sp.]|uniref:hypothetical protein n=1 Tax=Microcystis aeruginosa TaxID=1126 RepID=UPI0023312618|nr:hypothetical protein [Microcystis aeruginosa]MDB9508831.1 hypothetical protein [Microcystis aeruginosa CS-338/01]MEB3121061.1 hypothetical protein [Snowella sp.]
MSVTYGSQKIKSKTLETTTEVIIDNEKLEILTDNQLGIQEIKVVNDGEVINTITDSVQLSDYENKIFDAVIQSGIGENLVQLANSLKFQSKVDNADNLSNIQAVLTTVDKTRVLKVSLFIENDESRNIQVSFNDSQWNIEINQDDKNLVKYARILKYKLSAIPEKVFSINFEQLLLVSELGKPIMETPFKKTIKSFIQYNEFPYYTPEDEEYRQYGYNRDSWPIEKLPLTENGRLPVLNIRDRNCYKEDGIYYHHEYTPIIRNPKYDDFEERRDHKQTYGYNMPEWEADAYEIERDLRDQQKYFIDLIESKKNQLLNAFKHNSEEIIPSINNITKLLQILLVLINIFNTQELSSRSEYRFGQEDPKRNYQIKGSGRMIEIELVTCINSQESNEYFANIFTKLDAISGTRLFSSIAQQITDFNDILDNSKNLSNPEFYQRIYQQTIKSFQNNPEKIEIILADFYKLNQEPIFTSSSTILNTAKTIFINAIKPKSSITLETTIQINSAFPETITGIFISSDEPNTDTQLNIIVTENSQRIINNQNIANYQNKLFQEFFSEVVDLDQILDFTNTLKFITKQSSNNQYAGTLSSNDESYQINYRLIPTHQNQYTLHLQSTRFNWSNDYQINLDRQTFVNFLNRLDSELVDFIKSLENPETLLNKAITLTPYPANDFYSGYLTTQNQNNKIDYRIDIDAQNHQTSFTLTTNNHTWNYQLDTSNINQRNLIKHINPSFALQIEGDEALNALLNNDNIQAIVICRHNNTSKDAISIYSEASNSSPELTVLIPSSNIDPSLNNILGNSQVLRIEKHYLEGSCHYKLSFPKYEANAKPIKLTQQITSSGKIQVQTTEANPVKILDDKGNIQISHHSDQVSSEIKEVEHECFVEDANFTYHASGQLIISNLPAGITIEHYVKPPIQNILNGSEEPFIVLKSGDKVTFLADNLAKLTIRIL